MKMLLDDAGDKIIGNLTLFNDGITKNIGADRETVRELKTEQARIDALREIFDVDLTEEEKAGITPDLKLQP